LEELPLLLAVLVHDATRPGACGDDQAFMFIAIVAAARLSDTGKQLALLDAIVHDAKHSDVPVPRAVSVLLHVASLLFL
jgi:hypothetical protein